jgi:hypothetical protein
MEEALRRLRARAEKTLAAMRQTKLGHGPGQRPSLEKFCDRASEPRAILKLNSLFAVAA